jgi:hypothetical protein
MTGLQFIGIPFAIFGLFAVIIMQTEHIWGKWEIAKEVKAENEARQAARFVAA